MNKYKFLKEKMLELVNNGIISEQQYESSEIYFNRNRRENRTVSTIFTSIGIFLIALSIITLFAVNWNNISQNIKVLISFIPIVITSIMLYLSMNNDNSKMKLYTSIFAPISILATNSLISQVFHIQTEIYELIFTSVIMFLPIAFILRNYISIIVYGLGTIIYSFTATSDGYLGNIVLLKTVILALPLIIYNIKNYINDKHDNKNLIMWIINVSLVTLFVFNEGIFRSEVLLIYLYMIYFITQTLFDKDNSLNKILSTLFIIYLIISCISPFMFSYVSKIKLGYDTLLITIAIITFMYLSKAYKNLDEYFILVFIFFSQYLKLDKDIIFAFANIIVLALGVYKIIVGNRNNSYKQTRYGIFIIILLILFRFINSDLSFMEKSIMFLIVGICFTIIANVMKKGIGGKDHE